MIARDPPFLRAEQFIGVGIAMTKQSKPFWIGLMIYAASFLLMGVGSPIRGSGGIPAWLCAVFALVDPFTSPRIPNSPIYQHGTIEYVAMELSGCVNLVVLAFVGLVLFGRSPWIANVFRIMSPFDDSVLLAHFSLRESVPSRGARPLDHRNRSFGSVRQIAERPRNPAAHCNNLTRVYCSGQEKIGPA